MAKEIINNGGFLKRKEMVAFPVKRYHLLDAFRGLAILWIVCFHILVDVREQYGFILNHIISYGYLGVTIFFVISGYGIAASLSGGKNQEPFYFLSRRLKRVYPTYWWHLVFAALVIPVLSSLVLAIKTHKFDIVVDKYSAVEWIQIISLARVFSAVSWELNLPFLPLNGVIWYIAVIVQIYLFVAVCMYSKNKNHFLFLGFLCSILFAVPLVGKNVPYGLFIPYFSQFYIGVIVHQVLLKGHILGSRVSKLLLVFLCTGTLFYCSHLKNEYLLQLSFAVWAGSIFMSLHKYDLRLSSLIIVKLLILAGTFSYSLYLLHVPLWRFAASVVRNSVSMPDVLSAPFIVVPVIIILSFVWHLFFERASTPREVIGHLSAPVRTVRTGIGDAAAIVKSNFI